MRRLLTGAVDAGVADASLRVIAAFDDLVADGGTLQQLTDLAAAMLGREVYLRDDLLDRLVRAGAATEADLARLDQLAWQLGSRVERGRQAVAVDLDDRQFLAAGIEHAGGRLGTAWTERPDATGIAAEELVMERLTSAAAARILQDHDAVRPQEAGSTESLERLLAGDFSADGLVGMARRARLDLHGRYRVVVLACRPPGLSPEVLLRRALAAYGAARAGTGTAVGCVLGRSAVLVLPEAHGLGALAAAGENSLAGWSLAAGGSRPRGVGELDSGLLEARRVLALSPTPHGGVLSADDVGALLLLASIPTGDLVADQDVVRARALLDGGHEKEAEILEAYCLVGSLRKVAEQLFLHHSSVDYHVKRVERQLGFSVAGRTGQLRALLAIRLARLSRAGLVSSDTRSPTVVGRNG